MKKAENYEEMKNLLIYDEGTGTLRLTGERERWGKKFNFRWACSNRREKFSTTVNGKQSDNCSPKENLLERRKVLIKLRKSSDHCSALTFISTLAIHWWKFVISFGKDLALSFCCYKLSNSAAVIVINYLTTRILSCFLLFVFRSS